MVLLLFPQLRAGFHKKYMTFPGQAAIIAFDYAGIPVIFPGTEEGPDLRKLNSAMERFCYNHPRFGIPNLMKYIVAGNLLVYLLSVFSNAQAVSFLGFNLDRVLHGEVWRLVSFIFVSGYFSIRDLLWLAISLYFYYFIGNTLEREWGSAKFTLYYLCGMVLTIVAVSVSSLISGVSYTVYGTGYINLSMFFAFAMLYPEARVILIIFPVKIKWLAWLAAAFFGLSVIQAIFSLSLSGALLPIIAILNFLVFFWPELSDGLADLTGRARHQASPKTVQFKRAVRQEARQEQSKAYRHKCCVCGRTDADYPNLQFRYCSKCAGYHCYCEDHIFNHVHFTE